MPRMGVSVAQQSKHGMGMAVQQVIVHASGQVGSKRHHEWAARNWLTLDVALCCIFLLLEPLRTAHADKSRLLLFHSSHLVLPLPPDHRFPSGK